MAQVFPLFHPPDEEVREKRSLSGKAGKQFQSLARTEGSTTQSPEEKVRAAGKGRKEKPIIYNGKMILLNGRKNHPSVILSSFLTPLGRGMTASYHQEIQEPISVNLPSSEERIVE